MITTPPGTNVYNHLFIVNGIILYNYCYDSASSYELQKQCKTKTKHGENNIVIRTTCLISKQNNLSHVRTQALPPPSEQ